MCISFLCSWGVEKVGRGLAALLQLKQHSFWVCAFMPGIAHKNISLPCEVFGPSDVNCRCLFAWLHLVCAVQNTHPVLTGYKSEATVFQLLGVFKKLMSLHFGVESVWFFWPCSKSFYAIAAAAFVSKDQRSREYIYRLEWRHCSTCPCPGPHFSHFVVQFMSLEGLWEGWKGNKCRQLKFHQGCVISEFTVVCVRVFGYGRVLVLLLSLTYRWLSRNQMAPPSDSF